MLQSTAEFLELLLSSLTTTMKDRSLAFPLAIAFGAIAGIVCWILAAWSARLWNKRFHLKLSLQILCGFAAVLTLFCALGYASSKNMETAIKERLDLWRQKVTASDKPQEWQVEAFKDAWDAVARASVEPDVRLSPSPRTDTSITRLPMGEPETKKIAAEVYARAALEQFKKDNKYLASVLSAPGDVPSERLDQDLKTWFLTKGENPPPYPMSRGAEVVARMLQDLAGKQAGPVVEYTQNLMLFVFFGSQLLVFGAIAFVAQRTNRPA